MKSNRLLYLLPLLTLAILAGFFGWSLLSGRDPASIGSVMVGRPAPRLAAPALLPGQPALTDALLHSGKPVLVNFFASWCTPCLAEHPLLERLAKRDGITIIGIAWKNKPEEARAWLERLGNPFAQVGYDLDGKMALDWGLSGVPETFLIDAQGIVRLHFRAPLLEKDVNERIMPLLKAGS
ncbi:cytochrome c biogenesis protein CcmG, thiol:disulfide interchange protein DsbE [Enhydrobacter aerosaccus]|uniref:Cytochrome c biogenesis protein CcmG, thiol:disulfide interchange protein DsbE n=1 Tax=Enhydrobacter aerosaccus TaxID=225324 RepID=A0A1T4QMP9_9HYPH|nr:DsbE family thiol:disulfide interchange protein [Enhydrobacter aerosaccus]SKA04974.1 cytochrome c biogenesis protein CcmG, thiol:disulfide interchange protein DsbE [Enhydrobacter aerosaccus]